VEGIPNLFAIPATIDLAGAEIELVSVVARESRLRRAIEASTAEYDYIFIDCPTSLGLLTVNALVAAEEVLIPIQCEYYALEGVQALTSNIELVRPHLNPSLGISTGALIPTAPVEPPSSLATAPTGTIPRPATNGTAHDEADADAYDHLAPVPGARFAEVPVAAIVPNPRQPRQVFDEEAQEELKASI